MPVAYPNQTYDLALLTYLGATGLLAAEMGLSKADIIVDATTPLGDLTPADYTGYAQEAITWHLPSVSDGGVPELVSDQVIFRPTGTTVTNVIYTGWIETAGGAYYAPFRFDNPIPMQSALDELVAVVRWRMGELPRLEVVS